MITMQKQWWVDFEGAYNIAGEMGTGHFTKDHKWQDALGGTIKEENQDICWDNSKGPYATGTLQNLAQNKIGLGWDPRSLVATLDAVHGLKDI